MIETPGPGSATADPAPSAAPSSQPSPIAAVGSLVAATELEELALAAALIPAQLLVARETVVVFSAATGNIVERHPSQPGGQELELWAFSEIRDDVGGRLSKQGTRLAVGLDPIDGWTGIIAVDVASADGDTTLGLVELGRVVSRCIAQIASLKRRAAALEDARKSIGKGLHDLRTPLNSLRLGLHLLEPGLAGQDPQVVQRTHRAVDRLAALVTEMYESLHQTTATR
jgi:signal transduction histidine kinase